MNLFSKFYDYVFFFSAVVTVGFEAASLVVSESAGSVDVAVQLTEGTLATELPFEIVLSMLLAEG